MFSGGEVYRILRYTQRKFPRDYSVFDATGELTRIGNKAVETFLRGRKYIASYQESWWEADGEYYTPQTTNLKIPTGTLYCYEIVAVK
jgi:hypothetical protein